MSFKDVFIILVITFSKNIQAANQSHGYEKYYLSHYRDCDKLKISDHNEIMLLFIRSLPLFEIPIIDFEFDDFGESGFFANAYLADGTATFCIYPATNSCFLDICFSDKKCNCSAFNRSLYEYMQPKNISFYKMPQE